MPNLKKISPIIFLVVGGAIGALILGAINLRMPSIGEIIQEPPTISVVSSEALLINMKPLGELSSISRQYATAKIDVNLKYGFAQRCDITTRHTAQTTIKAGIDFNRIGERDIVYNEATETYTLTLPSPRLMDCIFDPFASEEYANSTPIGCNYDHEEMRKISTHVALEKFTAQALEANILEDAKNQTDMLLGNFVRALTGKNVVIRFKAAPANPVIPNSCQSSLPAEWVFDAADGSWSKD